VDVVDARGEFASPSGDILSSRRGAPVLVALAHAAARLGAFVLVNSTLRVEYRRLTRNTDLGRDVKASVAEWDERLNGITTSLRAYLSGIGSSNMSLAF
jgi:hypothetical protein